MTFVTRKRAVIGILAAALGSLAAFAPAPASASCTKPVNPFKCVDQQVCLVGDTLGLTCID